MPRGEIVHEAGLRDLAGDDGAIDGLYATKRGWRARIDAT
jgi:hypothetical protein